MFIWTLPSTAAILAAPVWRCRQWKQTFSRKYTKVQFCFPNDKFWMQWGDNAWLQPLFRIQGQVYHRIGSMVPSLGESPKFCQIYFIDNQESQVATRCQIVGGLRPDIVSSINQLLHNDNHYVQIFKIAKEMFDQQDVPTNIRVVINERKRPGGEHPRRYNNPLCDEVGALMPNENTNNRDIVLHYRDGGLQRISDYSTHWFSLMALMDGILIWN